MKNDEEVELSLWVHRDTPRAFLVSDDKDLKKAKWVPKSQIEVLSKNGGAYEIKMPQWLAKQRGFI